MEVRVIQDARRSRARCASYVPILRKAVALLVVGMLDLGLLYMFFSSTQRVGADYAHGDLY